MSAGALIFPVIMTIRRDPPFGRPPGPPPEQLNGARPGSFRPRPFQPAWWLPGPHLQTVVGKFLRPAPPLSLRRLRLDTADGDFLDLDVGPDPSPDAPVAVVLHGLEGSTRRAYLRLTLHALHRHGILAVGMNFRGCSGEPNRLPRFYHSGETGDLDVVLRELGRRFPGRPLGAVGFSLGGNVLLKHLGETTARGGDQTVAAAVAISVPFDLAGGTVVMEQGLMGRVYTHYFLSSLLGKVEEKRELLESLLDLDRVRRARTLREFDDAATAPLHGFRNADEYYTLSSSGPFLDQIRVPTLLLQSRDDPFLPEDRGPEERAAANPWIVPAFVPTGGHVGFVQGPTPWGRGFWAEEEAARFLAASLGA